MDSSAPVLGKAAYDQARTCAHQHKPNTEIPTGLRDRQRWPVSTRPRNAEGITTRAGLCFTWWTRPKDEINEIRLPPPLSPVQYHLSKEGLRSAPASAYCRQNAVPKTPYALGASDGYASWSGPFLEAPTANSATGTMLSTIR